LRNRGGPRAAKDISQGGIIGGDSRFIADHIVERSVASARHSLIDRAAS
jgi:hypothetical protein